jgi:hypothetical protein
MAGLSTLPLARLHLVLHNNSHIHVAHVTVYIDDNLVDTVNVEALGNLTASYNVKPGPHTLTMDFSFYELDGKPDVWYGIDARLLQPQTCACGFPIIS